MSVKEFRIVNKATDAWRVVSVSGELDVVSAPRLQSAIESAAPGRRGLVIDMTDVSFLDSGGLSVLVGAKANAEEYGGTVVLVVREARVMRALEVTGLDAE